MSVNAATKRHAGEIALQIVAPLMVRAGDGARVAPVGAAELDAAMSAAVEHHVDPTGLVTHHHYRALATVTADKISGLRYSGLERDVIPVGAGKDARLLQGVHVRIRIDPIRNSAEPLERPAMRVLRDCFHVSSPYNEAAQRTVHLRAARAPNAEISKCKDI